MKRQRFYLLALAVATMLAMDGWFATPIIAQAASELQAPAADPATLLSPPALQIASMVASGVSDDELIVFIGNFPSPFSLTAQGIICLQQLGVSSAVTLAMLNHDLFLSNNPGAVPPISLAGPDTQPLILPPTSFPVAVNQPQLNDQPPLADGYSPEADSSFNDLAQYGSWDFLGGSGWCWQPSSWLGYFSYPWGLTQFQNGCWWHHPNRGWLWFPHANRIASQNVLAATHQINPAQTPAHANGDPHAVHHSRQR